MRTNTAESVKSHVHEECAKNVRMSLHVLQPAATDKENLVGPGRSIPIGLERNKSEHEKKIPEGVTKSISKKKKMSKINIEESNKRTVTASDLTNEEPSENYWKQLAEKRREALEEALTENEVLSQRIEILEQENTLTKEMLKEARDLIEVLNEIIDGEEQSVTVSEATPSTSKTEIENSDDD